MASRDAAIHRARTSVLAHAGRSVVIRLLAGLIAALALLATTGHQAEAATLADFGWRTFRVAGEPALGERPLLVLLLNWQDEDFDSTHGPVYYRNLLFGTDYGTTAASIGGSGARKHEQNACRHCEQGRAPQAQDRCVAVHPA